MFGLINFLDKKVQWSTSLFTMCYQSVEQKKCVMNIKSCDGLTFLNSTWVNAKIAKYFKYDGNFEYFKYDGSI